MQSEEAVSKLKFTEYVLFITSSRVMIHGCTIDPQVSVEVYAIYKLNIDITYGQLHTHFTTI